jgi:hypothetical protein
MPRLLFAARPAAPTLAFASAPANARPSPDDAPVTNATFQRVGHKADIINSNPNPKPVNKP